MFFSKLWLRLKGEILTMKGDLPSEDELRAKAGEALEKLKQRVERDPEQDRVEGPAQKDTLASDDRDRPAPTPRKEDGATGAKDSVPLPPNPRRLG